MFMVLRNLKKINPSMGLKEKKMKKVISILTAVIFLAVSYMVYASDDQEGSQLDSGDGIGVLVLLSSVLIGIAAVGITLTLKKASKNDAAIIFNEATTSHGERSNLEILAKLYEISVDEVIDIISKLVANGDIDISLALTDDEAAWKALTQLNQAIETFSQKNERNHQSRLEKFREKFKTQFPDLNQRPTTLELANFYRGFFGNTSETVN
jgi:hypothetical protein